MEYIEITSKNRKVKEMYLRCGYGEEIVREMEDRFPVHKEFTKDNKLLYTYYVGDRLLFEEYFDTEKKIWVYKTPDMKA